MLRVEKMMSKRPDDAVRNRVVGAFFFILKKKSHGSAGQFVPTCCRVRYFAGGFRRGRPTRKGEAKQYTCVSPPPSTHICSRPFCFAPSRARLIWFFFFYFLILFDGGSHLSVLLFDFCNRAFLSAVVLAVGKQTATFPSRLLRFLFPFLSGDLLVGIHSRRRFLVGFHCLRRAPRLVHAFVVPVSSCCLCLLLPYLCFSPFSPSHLDSVFSMN